jgi:hypothetical protein
MVQVLPLALLLVLVQAAAGAPSGAPSAVCAPCGPAATSTLIATRDLATLCGRDQHFRVDEKRHMKL